MSTDMAPRFAVMGVLVVSLAACSQPMTETAATRADAPSAGLEGTSWNAVQVYGTAVRPDAAAPDLRPYLVFAAEGRVSGSDGCNRLSGRYTANGANGVTFGQMASTRMACPGHDDLAQQFQAALNGTNRWSIVQDRLEIYDAAGKPVAVFERRP